MDLFAWSYTLQGIDHRKSVLLLQIRILADRRMYNIVLYYYYINICRAVYIVRALYIIVLGA